MTDSLFIFGNGLGRSIDSDFFDLKPAMAYAWNTENILTERQKELIIDCLPTGLIIEPDCTPVPSGEDQLEDLQRVLSACDTIANFERRTEDPNAERWLSDHGREFPTAIRKFLHQSACYFLNRDSLRSKQRDSELSCQFTAPLRDYIVSNGAHVATLNYDDLLYEAFTDTKVFQNHLLRDGFFNGKFDMDRAEKLYSERTEGWFLHLHGSPLFINIDAQPQKVTRAQISNFAGTESTHLVLTSVKFKPVIIQQSEILKRYWEKFDKALEKSKNTILVGYSGLDNHLNRRLAKADQNSIRIVERENDQTIEEREIHWKKKLSRDDFEIFHIENIQDFSDWEKL